MQILNISKKVLGEEHPSILRIMHNLASIYQTQSQWIKAEELQAKVLNTSKKMLDEKHPNTLTIINSLGSINREQDR
jgi:hypothetical protein